MKQTLKAAGKLGLDVLFTVVLAWIGHRWIAGFDIRGPFLLMSPLYAIGLMFLIGTTLIRNRHCDLGAPKHADEELIQSTALEFGFGSVDVNKRKCGEDQILYMIAGSGLEMGLPKNWDDLKPEARRFAIVRSLVETNEPWTSRFLTQLPSYATRYAAMLVCGINLWLILACHGLYATWFAYNVFVQRAKLQTRKDEKALRVMRDIKAAIAFVKADPMNKSLQIDPDLRVAAIRRAAGRMGIGSSMEK